MSLLENNPVHSLIRSFSNESRGLKASRTQSKLKENFCKKLKEIPQIPTNTLPKNYTKVNLKSRVVLPQNHDFTVHKRTISQTTDKNTTNMSQIHVSLDLFESFLTKLEIEKSVESQVSLLINFLNEVSKTFRTFSEVFTKIGEIVKEYQRFVKSLDSTRVDNHDLPFEIKNKIFSQDQVKVINYKPLSEKRGHVESSTCLNISADSSVNSKDINRKPRFSLKNLKLAAEPLENLKPVTSISKIPGLQLNLTSKADFHDEFMRKIDEFSESWREEAMKLKK